MTRILVLHSHVAPDAPPEEQDTMVQAHAVAGALRARGHPVSLDDFFPAPGHLESVLARHRPGLVFNLVEGVDGLGLYAHLAPERLAALGMPFTGCDARAMQTTLDKTMTKRLFRAANLPTPDWCEPPEWTGLNPAAIYVVKSAVEDASVGLDDDCVVPGADVPARALRAQAGFGGRWFAESYVDGREFNIGVIETPDGPRVMPLAEMTFAEWPTGKPRIVGYTAKWAEDSFAATRTVRRFGVEDEDPVLAARLRDLSLRAWNLFGLSGYARVDFRVTAANEPLILEINANPCISPDAGLTAAAERAGYSYGDMIAAIIGAVRLPETATA